MAVASLLAVSLPAAGAQQPGTSLSEAAALEVGTWQEPAIHEIEVDDEEDLFIDLDIPDGQRVHAAFTIDSTQAPEGANLSADILDTDGNFSSFNGQAAVNTDSGGLLSGYVRSEPMDPANRSWGRDTVLRLKPTGSDYDVQLSLSYIPVVVDGGGLQDVDRPGLRFEQDLTAPEDPAPVDATPGESIEAAGELEPGLTTQNIAAEETQYFRVPLGWMQALDGELTLTEAGEAGQLSLKMFNAAHESMSLTGQWELPTDAAGSAVFGQHAPAHYKNVSAGRMSRNSGFLGEHVFLAVTNTSASDVGYELALAQRGEAIAPAPVFDPAAAAEQASTVEAVDHEQYRAPGFEDPAWRQWLNNPLLWVAGGLLLVAILLAVLAIRRR